MTIAIGPGTAVTLHFALLMEDGSEVDSTFERSPASFVFGDGNLLPGVEAKLQGLTAGQQATLTLAPKMHSASATLQISSVCHAASLRILNSVKAWYSILLTQQIELPGVVSAIDGEQVEIDFNHPWRGNSSVSALRFSTCRSMLAMKRPVRSKP